VMLGMTLRRVHKETTPVTLIDSDLSALLAALKAATSPTRSAPASNGSCRARRGEGHRVIGAGPHERTQTRTTQRNGHRPRVLSTAAGDLELQIPKLRTGSFFSTLLGRRRRIDRALFAVVMEVYVHGVSTRKVDDLVAALGVGSGISKSEVSRICVEPTRDVSLTTVVWDAEYSRACAWGSHIISAGPWLSLHRPTTRSWTAGGSS
jgi:putative transposase